MPESKAPRHTDNQANTCHSRYAPEVEARRHLDASLAGRRPALIFILGAGRNFLGTAIRQSLPGTLTVVLQACADFDTSLVDPGDLYWSPGSAYPIESILASALAYGKAAGGIGIIEWPPAARGCMAVLENIRALLHKRLELYAAESATTAYWGKRWIKNSIDFACGDGPLTLPCPGTAPLVLACAGPGLHDSLPAIREAGGNIRLWALASAHQTLIKEGLDPELVFATDPGFWNSAHLAAAARKGCSLAATPSTKLGAAILDGQSPVVPVCTGLGFELDALAAAGDISAIEASASGTAAGTALSVATMLNTGPIYVCGLDLAARGLSEHATPYAFDILDELNAGRLQPSLASRFSRVMDRFPESNGSWRLSRAFSAYASDTAPWSNQITIFRVSNSPVDMQINRMAPDLLPSAWSTAQATTRTALSGSRSFHRKLTRKARYKAMIDLLKQRSERALATLKECADAGLPVPRETVLELFAFGGKGCAGAIAMTARAEAGKQDILDAENAVRSGLSCLTGGLR